MAMTPEQKILIDRLVKIGSLDDHFAALIAKVSDLQQSAERAVRQTETVRRDIEQIIDEKTKGFPWLADAIAQYEAMCDLKIAEFLDRKLQPAQASAERVRAIAKEKQALSRKYRLARNRVKYYEALFPWLSEYVGDDLDELVEQVDKIEVEGAGDQDPVLRYVTSAEYSKLSEAQRNQLALDRYWKSRRTPWQVGRDYERFVGYLYEIDGFAVRYHGATERLGDMGRDLIAVRGRDTLIIQCKYWREERVVRDKHVFHLFGTAVGYFIEKGGKGTGHQFDLFPDLLSSARVQPVIVTSTICSDEAKAFAGVLGVQLRQRLAFDVTYPCIKCNVSRRASERIYHLPMDQQYDRTVIEPNRGERYVRTVSEAEKAGFRRAWRWQPDEGD